MRAADVEQRRRPHALRRAARRARRPAGRTGARRRAQRAERARGDRGRPRGRRARRGDRAALAEFKGVGRRFQRYGDVALAARRHVHADRRLRPSPGRRWRRRSPPRARAFPGRRVVLAFQPHRYTRTRDLFEDFVRVLSTVDALVLADVYPAGEAPIVAADGRALARAMRVAGQRRAGVRRGRRRRRRRRFATSRATATSCSRWARARSARVPAQLSAAHDDARAARLRRPARHARARRVARAAHELARRRRADVALPAGRSRRPRAVPARSCRRHDPVTVLGLGSNLLVRDGGMRGAVVLLHNPGAALAVADGLVYADAGVASPKLARFAALHGCADAEFLAGIPGTVGGALAMNAGCYGGETWTLRRARRSAVARRPLRRAHAGRLRDRLPQRHAPRRPRARRHLHRRVVPLSAGRRRDGRARASGSCSRGASRRSRSRCPTPAACSAIRPAITPRG